MPMSHHGDGQTTKSAVADQGSHCMENAAIPSDHSCCGHAGGKCCTFGGSCTCALIGGGVYPAPTVRMPGTLRLIHSYVFASSMAAPSRNQSPPLRPPAA